MDWRSGIKGFEFYLKLEKGLAENSIEAYIHDTQLLHKFLSENPPIIDPDKIKLSDLETFLAWIYDEGMNARSQARIISGIRAFYQYLMIEEEIKVDPTLTRRSQTQSQIAGYVKCRRNQCNFCGNRFKQGSFA